MVFSCVCDISPRLLMNPSNIFFFIVVYRLLCHVTFVATCKFETTWSIRCECHTHYLKDPSICYFQKKKFVQQCSLQDGTNLFQIL